MGEVLRMDQIGRKPLTERQKNVYKCILRYQNTNGYAPTIRELCRMAGLKSTSSVAGHLKLLEEKGYIVRKTECPRAIAVL